MSTADPFSYIRRRLALSLFRSNESKEVSATVVNEVITTHLILEN